MSASVVRVVGGSGLDSPCPSGGDCWDFEPGYELQLEPVQALIGPAQTAPHRANYFAHSGFPEFAHYEYALVFEFSLEGGEMRLARTGFPLARASDGRYVYCADQSRDEDDLWRGGRPVRLAAPLRLSRATAGMTSGDLEYASMAAGTRSCRHGFYASELAARYASEVEPSHGQVIVTRAGRK